MSLKARLGLVAPVLAIVVVALIIIKPGSNKSSSNQGSASTATTQSKPTHIYIRNAKPVGGVGDITVNKGESVRLAITSDTAGEVHIHGYDYMKHVAAGRSVRFNFPAKIDGVFEVELHHPNGVQIAKLKVEP